MYTILVDVIQTILTSYIIARSKCLSSKQLFIQTTMSSTILTSMPSTMRPSRPFPKLVNVLKQIHLDDRGKICYRQFSPSVTTCRGALRNAPKKIYINDKTNNCQDTKNSPKILDIQSKNVTLSSTNYEGKTWFVSYFNHLAIN